MEITVTENINIIGWKEGQENAPAAAITLAKTKANEGGFVAFGKTDDGNWVVVALNPDLKPFIAWKQSNE